MARAVSRMAVPELRSRLEALNPSKAPAGYRLRSISTKKLIARFPASAAFGVVRPACCKCKILRALIRRQHDRANRKRGGHRASCAPHAVRSTAHRGGDRVTPSATTGPGAKRANARPQPFNQRTSLADKRSLIQPRLAARRLRVRFEKGQHGIEWLSRLRR